MDRYESLARRLGIEGRYKVLSLIDEGGMGKVYRALQCSLDRTVALKVLNPNLTDSPQLVQRVLDEARLAARIAHSNVVGVLEPGRGERDLYIVYELVDGRSLRKLFQEGLPIGAALGLLGQAADGLQAIHEAGAVHRDIKPENMLVDVEGRLKVTDLGVARDLTRGQMTAAGTIFGTPAYMSPEQCRGDKVGPASDIYSLSVVAYEALTGKVPFDGSPAEVIQDHLGSEPPPLSSHREGLPEEWDRLLLRCLSKEPHRRPKRAADLSALLGRMA